MASRPATKVEEPLAQPKGVTGAANPSGDRTEPGVALTDKAWNRLRHNGRLVHDEITGQLPPVLRPLAWQAFQQMPLARSACWLVSQLEPQQSGQPGLYRRRRRRPAGAGLFDDIPQQVQRHKAKEIYAELCDRHAERLASCPWLRPVLAGRARWMATNRDARDSEWGKQMRRRKGGKHTQRRYREESRHPLPAVRRAWGLREEEPKNAHVPSAARQAMTKRTTHLI